MTIGAFDGIHIGHRRILTEVVMLARGLGAWALVVTFDPHPTAVLRPEQAPCLLTALDEKMALIGQSGVDEALVLRFSPKFAERSAEWFVKNLLIKRVGMRRLVIGYDFRFGRNRQGDATCLEDLGEKLGFGVDIVPPVTFMSHPVSSTRVRTALVRGDVRSASCMLGRDFAVTGEVVKGVGRGRLLDCPTANLRVTDCRKILPANGVYAARMRMGKVLRTGVVYVGTRPTFGGGGRSLEAHVMGLSRPLYGRKLEVLFVDRIRDERTFRSGTALRRRIERDLAVAARLLRN